MTSHALRDLDALSVRQVVCYPSGAEGVAAYRGFNSRIGSATAEYTAEIPAQQSAYRRIAPSRRSRNGTAAVWRAPTKRHKGNDMAHR
jgi:hypothetical protein